MPDSPGEGGQFAADLYELYEVAQNDLRPLAEQYSGYSAKLSQSDGYNLDPSAVAGTMTRDNSFFRSGSDIVALRNDVQFAFAKSSENIEAAAVTLIGVAESYATADDEAQSDFDALMSEGFPDGETGRPPHHPVYPGGGGPTPRA
jgi:hypothetical protein